MIFQLFYEKLYRSEIYSSVESDMESFFEWPEHTQKLKPLLKPYVNKPIGLTSEFYKEFEDLVVPPLLRMLSHSFETGGLPHSMLEAN